MRPSPLSLPLSLFLFLAAALLHGPGARADAPPVYVLKGDFANAAVYITVNGIPVWATDTGGEVKAVQAINTYLKPGLNDVGIAIRKAGTGHKPRLGLLIGVLPSADAEEMSAVVFRLGDKGAPTLPFDHHIDLDVAAFPMLDFWRAEEATPDLVAEEAIAADLKRIEDALKAAADKRDAAGIADAMLSGSAGSDLERAMGEAMAAQTRGDITGAAELGFKQTGVAIRTHPAARAGQLVIEPITTRHVRVRRAGGGPLTGLIFTPKEKAEFGLFMEAPIYGRVDGKWRLLRN